MNTVGIISLLSAAVYWLAGWFLFFGVRRLDTVQSQTGRRPCSVIIPARNEEKTLPVLLESLQKQRAKIEEIIVVNDASDDRTAEVAARYGCRVVDLTGKPDGWSGKAWACWNGAKKATSATIVFLDADVVCGENAIQLLLSAHDQQGGLVSAQPKHRTEKLYEQISAFFNIVSVAAAGKRGGFGPCMACSRHDYFKVGGHEAIRENIVDDFALARLFIENGKKVTSFLGGAQLSFRMYPGGIRDLIEGWTKNMASGLSLSNPASVILIFVWFTGIINAVLSLIRSAGNSQVVFIAGSVIVFALYAAQVALLLSRVGRFYFITSLFFPLFLLFFLVFFFVSALLTAVFKKVRWKGRVIYLR